MREKRAITDPRTLRAMAHPVRMDIMEQLATRGPLTASQLGERLDESPANCSWHLRKLAEHGFVEEAPGGRGRQRPWQVSHLGMSWGEQELDRTIGVDEALAGQALTDVVVGREVRRLHDSQVRVRDDAPDWRRASFLAQSIVWLTAEELEEANAAVREVLLRHLDRHEDPTRRPEGARLCALVGWGVPTYDMADRAANESATGPATDDPSARSSEEA